MAIGSQLWFNGKLASTEETKISLLTHTLHYGVGVFEGIRAYRQTRGGGAIFRLKEHTRRFFESSKILGLNPPFSEDEINQACIDVCKANEFEECYVRPILYIGEGPLGLSLGEAPPIQIAILNWEWGRYLGDEGVKKGIRLKTSSFNRPQVNSIMTKGKICGQYVTSVLAKREATSMGYDEGLFLDTDGFVAECSGENIFMIKDGIVKTTPLTSVLAGITRQTVIQHLREQGHEVQEVRFSKDELWCADEVFLCGTAAEITPVREIDDRPVGKGSPGPIGLKMQKDYHAIVRGDVPPYGNNWLTAIR